MSDFDRLGVPENILDRLRRVEEQLFMLQTRNLEADNLAEISPVLADMTAGRFIASDSEDTLDPEDATYTGMFMAASLQTIADGTQARLAEVLNGVAQFWVANGAAWAGSGAVQLDADGITIAGGSGGSANQIKFMDDGQSLPLLSILGYDITSAYLGQIKVDGREASQNTILKLMSSAGNGDSAELSLIAEDSIGGLISQLSLYLGEIVVNERGGDVNFRVESDADANLIFGDAGANRVGIGTATPAGKLHVASTANEIGLIVQGYTGQTADLLQIRNSAGAVQGVIDANVNLVLGGTATGANARLYALKSITTDVATRSFIGQATTSGSVNFTNPIYAFYGLAQHNGTGTATYIIAMTGEAANMSSGTVTEIRGVSAVASNNGAGTTGSAMAYRAAVVKVAGTINNAYGLYVSDITAGTNNYAIVTNAGLVVFNEGGDGGADIRWESDTEAYMLWGDANGSTDGALFFGGQTDALEVLKGGDTFWIGTGSGLPYGAFYGNEITQTQAAAQNTWYAVNDTDIVDGQTHLVTGDGAGKLTVSKAGTYLITWSMTVEVGSPNKHINGGIMVNGSALSRGQSHGEMVTAGQEYVLASSCIKDLAANDYVQLAFQTIDTGTPTIEIDDVNLTLVHIGGS